VKYLPYKNGIYSYKPYYYTDKEMYSEVKLVGADEKLSEMVLSKPGIVFMYLYGNMGTALNCVW